MTFPTLVCRLSSQFARRFILGFTLAAALLPAAASAQGSITGTVTNGVTSATLASVVILITDSAGNYAGTTQTNGVGVYATNSLAAGTYYIYTRNSLGFLDQIYAGVNCTVQCYDTDALNKGTPIVITTGNQTGRNFALQPAGAISGKVTNASSGANLAGVNIEVHTVVSGTASYVTTVTTDGGGVYLVQGLPAGSYYLLTSSNIGFVNEIYNNVPCQPYCSQAGAVSTGTAVSPTPGLTTGSINFALDPGAAITGTVTGVSGPLANVNVLVYTAVSGAPTYQMTVATNASGVYSASQLIAGTYYLHTSSSVGHIDEIYDNIPCPEGCSPLVTITAGTPIAVAAGATASGRNFALGQGGNVTGRVTDQATGSAIPGVTVTVIGPIPASATTDAAGDYAIAALPGGTYRAYTANSLGYINKVFDDVLCPGACSSGFAAASGTPIAVTIGSTVSGRNFRLPQGGSVTGTVTSTATGGPIAGVTVNLYSFQGSSVQLSGTAMTNGSGAYSIGGLLAGTVYAL